MPEDPPAPKRRAFISYRHESEEHRRAVLTFCQRLNQMLGDNSVEIVNDQTLLETRPAGPDEGWNRWSMNNAAHADRVIGIVSPGWFAAMDQKHLEPTPLGKGSAVEATVIFNRHTDGRTVSPWLRLVRLPTFPDTETNWLMRDIPLFFGDNDSHIEALGKWIKGADAQAPALPPSPVSQAARPKAPAPPARRGVPGLALAAGAAVVLIGGFFVAKPLIGGSSKKATNSPGDSAASPTSDSSTGSSEPTQPPPPPALALNLPQNPAAGDLGEVPLNATTTMKFRWCPPGTFTMGRTREEIPHVQTILLSVEDWDREQQAVSLPQGFWMAETELTRGEMAALRGSGSPAADETDALPETSLTHADAVAAADALRRKVEPAGLTARLPSEAEWEYACRATTTGIFGFGETIDFKQANFDPTLSLDGKPTGLNQQKTVVPVRKYRANRGGIYYNHGNVSEWCATGGPISDPPLTPPPDGTFPVRGGSFDSYSIKCTSGTRSFIPGAPGNSKTGARLMLTFATPP